MSALETRNAWKKIASAYAEGGFRLVVSRAFRLTIGQRWDDGWPKRANFAVWLRRRISNRPIVHAIGDSHSQVLTGVTPFLVTWLGPATAYNIGNPASTTDSYGGLRRALRRVAKRRDVILLILGEIDSRIHIYNQYMKLNGQVPISTLIERTVARYGRLVLQLRGEGYRVVVQSVPATPYQDNIFDYPYYADDSTRAAIVNEFNQALSAWCVANGVEYFDVYHLASDEQGFILKALTEDGTHLSVKALPIYQEWIERNVDARRDTK